MPKKISGGTVDTEIYTTEGGYVASSSANVVFARARQ